MINLKVSLGEPVLVSVSKADESRWGFHQFPTLNETPEGNILLMYADAEDASETHGSVAPAFKSNDGGASWMPTDEEPRPIRPHYSISKIFDDEYLVVPASRYLNTREAGIALPNPAAADSYGIRYTYRLSDLPRTAQKYFRYLPAKRWRSKEAGWMDDVVEYDTEKLLAWRQEKSDVLPRTFFERPLLRYRGELLYADYRGKHAFDDGSVPPKGGTTLMVSSDNGKSFHRRSVVAADPSGNDLMGEPQLATTADGRLICVIRRADQKQKPMCVTWSEDGGCSWTPVKDLFEFGVWPCALLLGSGVLALSYGRPGVHLAFDPTGTGENWTERLTIIHGDHDEVHKHTCGYTSLLPLNDNTFLIAYSDFMHEDENGERRKAIFTRRVSVDKTELR